MNKILCSARSIECDCGPYECRHAQPAPVAPVVRFSVPSILLISAALGIAAYFVGGWAVSRMDDSFHRQQLANQENVTWKR